MFGICLGPDMDRPVLFDLVLPLLRDMMTVNKRKERIFDAAHCCLSLVHLYVRRHSREWWPVLSCIISLELELHTVP